MISQNPTNANANQTYNNNNNYYYKKHYRIIGNHVKKEVLVKMH